MTYKVKKFYKGAYFLFDILLVSHLGNSSIDYKNFMFITISSELV